MSQVSPLFEAPRTNLNSNTNTNVDAHGTPNTKPSAHIDIHRNVANVHTQTDTSGGQGGAVKTEAGAAADMAAKNESVAETKPDPDRKPSKLSTSSPEALRVAAEITPHRLANLLIRKGPLAIRVITAQLAAEVPGFELLSLSKQRRLIMAAMEQGDAANNVVFEKIGWGQWAVRRSGSDYIVTDAGTEPVSVHELREKAKLGWSKKSAAAARRDSISKGGLHSVRVPDEHGVQMSGDHGMRSPENESDSASDSDDDMDMLEQSHIDVQRESQRETSSRARAEVQQLSRGRPDDTAIAEDSDEEDLFAFDEDHKSPPLFAQRVPTKISPPPVHGRRKSSSAVSNGVAKNTNYSRHQIFNRNRLNSLENLDNYIVSSARNSSFSVSSPPPAGSVGSASPLGSWGANQGAFALVEPLVRGRRKSSFNESSMRSTLSASRRESRTDASSDTDEEDWASMGAESLRKNSAGSSPSLDQAEERTAARALVNLMTI
ncbi:putative Sin3 binding family protein [Clavispora lusitaniae]|uniref:putative Sin3 binding family protein n=1 Tax=Clavispora lusitaniae TaxID=36911 RepID=UPI0016A08BE2|nr:DNA-binding proteins Bright/BRCAA1/RBP1 and proteins containing BRIGHT domain [Clavispora lusitaniae]KAF7582002.1 putative Sin3 binding family protein [Clavispora lusitaniae]